MSSTHQIAIDGPAGAGKSTIAKAIATKLSYIYVDTGAMYRAMALYFLKEEVLPDEEEKVRLACQRIKILIEYEDGIQQIFLNGENVTSFIRNEEVGNMASAISGYGCVREQLIDIQRQLASQCDVVMDGRDIGTFVLPEANVKVYLTASSAIRAKRRFDELKQKGVMCNLQEIEQDIIERDHRDMNREVAPLKKAEDAVLIDGSDMTLEEVIHHMMILIRERIEWK